MALQKLTPTTNFLIFYEGTIPNALARAQAVNQVCEAEFNDLAAWFGISSAFGSNDRINVYLDQPDNSGAFNRGYQSGGESEIRLDVQSANLISVNAGEMVRML